MDSSVMGPRGIMVVIFLAVAIIPNQGVTEQGQDGDNSRAIDDTTTEQENTSVKDDTNKTVTATTFTHGEYTTSMYIIRDNTSAKNNSSMNMSNTDLSEVTTQITTINTTIKRDVTPKKQPRKLTPKEIIFVDCYRKNSYPKALLISCCSKVAHGYDMITLAPKKNAKDFAYVVVEFWFSLFLCLFGLVGNMISLIVLSREKTNTSMFFLKALATSDGLYCLWYMIFIPYLVAYEHTDWISPCARSSDIAHWIPLHQKKIGVINYILQMTSIWLVVLLTIDRFIAVSMPLQAKVLCTLTKARIQVGTLVVLCIGFALPRAFQFTNTLLDNECINTPETRIIRLEFTEFGKSYGMTIGYDIVVTGLVRYVIPVFMVLIMNILLIRILKSASASRVELAKGGSSEQGRGITVMLVTVATTYTILLLPLVPIKILRSLYFFERDGTVVVHPKISSYIDYVVLAGNLCLRLNSSINFLLYTAVSHKFRKGLLELIRCTRVTKTDSSSSYVTQSSSANTTYKY